MNRWDYNLKALLVVPLFLIVNIGFAQKFDLSAGLQGRTYPSVGAMTFADGGYGHLLWGRKNSFEDWQYGFIRIGAKAGTSAVVNQLELSVDVHPVSILGIGFGKMWDSSDLEFNFFNCTESNCRNNYERDFGRVKALVGYKDFIWVNQLRFEEIKPSREDKPFTEYAQVMLGEAQGDRQQILQSLFAYRLDLTEMLGVLYTHAQMEQLNQSARGYHLFYQRPQWTGTLGFGVGYFESSVKPNGGMQAVFRFIHKFEEGFGLF